MRILCQPVGDFRLRFIRESHVNTFSSDFDRDPSVVLPPGCFVLWETVPSPVRQRIERFERLETRDVHPEREPAVPDLSRTARIRGVGYNVVSGDDLFPVDRSPASEKYGCT